MRVCIIILPFFLILQHNFCFAQLKEKNILIVLKDNKLTAGQSVSLVLNPGSKLAVPVFLQIAIIDQSFSIVHQQRILFNKAIEYRWDLPAELKKGLYIATVSVENENGTETIGIPFSYLYTEIQIPKTNVMLPVQLDSIFYGFNLKFKTNIASGKPVYYTLATQDSVKGNGIVKVDSLGLIEVGGNNFYENGEIVFSLLDTCNKCIIEPFQITNSKSNIDYLTSIFKQVDNNLNFNDKNISITENISNLPNVVVQTRVKTRKELYEAKYVNNFMLKSPMSREVIVDDDPLALNYNNNLSMYLVKVFPGLYTKNGGLYYRLGSVAYIVDEVLDKPAPDYLSDIAYIKFLPEPPRGLNTGAGFFNKANRAIAGTTATIVIYTKKNYEESFIPKKTISLQVQGTIDATK